MLNRIWKYQLREKFYYSNKLRWRNINCRIIEIINEQSRNTNFRRIEINSWQSWNLINYLKKRKKKERNKA